MPGYHELDEVSKETYEKFLSHLEEAAKEVDKAIELIPQQTWTTIKRDLDDLFCEIKSSIRFIKHVIKE